MMAPLLALLVLLATPPVAAAQTTVDLERQAEEIEAMLIAPCCFSQQVSVHKSPAADEAKADIRRRLAAGESKQQILDAYVAQHGKHVLAEPPAEGFDITLYVTPFILLIGSLGLLTLFARHITRHGPAVASGPAGVSVPPSRAERLDDELRDLD